MHYYELRVRNIITDKRIAVFNANNVYPPNIIRIPRASILEKYYVINNCSDTGIKVYLQSYKINAGISTSARVYP